MLLFKNTRTKPISIPYGTDVITVQPWWEMYITPEQYQFIKDTCPDAIFTVEVPSPVVVPTVDYTWISIEWALTDTTWALFWIQKTIKEDGTETFKYIDIAWATYTPSWIIRVANNDREFITGSKCYTDGTDDFAIITGINKSAPTDIVSIVYYVNQTTGATLSTQPSPRNPCPAPAVISLNIQSAWVSIADWTYAALLWPDGISWTNSWNLKSVSIKARKGTNNDAILWSWASQIVINTLSNKFVLFPDDGAITYSVDDGNIQEFLSVKCIKNSAALVIFNYL